MGQRPIQRRVDDSVVAVRQGTPFMVRRARGYVPASVAQLNAPAPILAVGADLKNAIALAVGGEVFVSQHIGDLGDLETDRAFEEAIEDLLTMYAVDRETLVIAHDLHPQYVSTRFALNQSGARHIAIQHHEAHIASVLLEHRRLNETVIGIALDGTGYGRDETIWGGEVLVGSVQNGFQRQALFEPVLMPGGDAAARHPVQAAAAYLPDVDPSILEGEPFAFPARFRQAQALLRTKTRTIPTTSIGRLFDAAAAICGFIREISYEGQAAKWLEHQACDGHSGKIQVDTSVMSPQSALITMVDARRSGYQVADLSAWFHGWFVGKVVQAVINAAAESKRRTIVFSGGVWQNRLLLDETVAALPDQFDLLWGQQIPVNGGGICVGQIAIASCGMRIAGNSSSLHSQDG